MIDLLISCYRSGQIEEREWQALLKENAELAKRWLSEN